MTETEVYQTYEQMELVKTLVLLIQGEVECAEETRQAAVKYLISIGHRAMNEAGIFANENGQWEFADCVFFDFLMTDEKKIFWLKECGPSQLARINFLVTRKGVANA
jgi:hypothetical protein